MQSFSPRSMLQRLVVLAAAALMVAAAGCGPSAYKITPVPVDQTLEEKVLINEGGLAPPKIALLDLSGVLMNQEKDTLISRGENPVSLLVEMLNKAAKDKSVKAVVLRINSPGGSVTASDILYNEIMRFRTDPKNGKPVIAIIMDVGASGAYYTACACDEIVAYRTSVVGSIGVIMITVNFAGTMDKIGVEAVAIKSGEMKDAGSPFRKMKPAERELFQGLIDSFYARFVEVVAAGRPELDADRVREIADGRVWTSQQALELGLIDRIGTLREALQATKERIGAESVRVVTYHRPLEWKSTIYAEGPSVTNYGLVNVTLPSTSIGPAPHFLYLWAPGL